MVAGHQPWQVLSALPAWQLTQVPRAAQRRDDGRPDGGPAGDGAVQRAAGAGVGVVPVGPGCRRVGAGTGGRARFG